LGGTPASPIQNHHQQEDSLEGELERPRFDGNPVAHQGKHRQSNAQTALVITLQCQPSRDNEQQQGNNGIHLRDDLQ
jgi:hypothetical protein